MGNFEKGGPKPKSPDELSEQDLEAIRANSKYYARVYIEHLISRARRDIQKAHEDAEDYETSGLRERPDEILQDAGADAKEALHELLDHLRQLEDKGALEDKEIELDYAKKGYLL